MLIYVKLGLREALCWPKNGLRSNLIASKFHKFLWGAGPHTPLAVACLCTHYEPDHSKLNGYGPAAALCSVVTMCSLLLSFPLGRSLHSSFPSFLPFFFSHSCIFFHFSSWSSSTFLTVITPLSPSLPISRALRRKDNCWSWWHTPGFRNLGHSRRRKVCLYGTNILPPGSCCSCCLWHHK